MLGTLRPRTEFFLLHSVTSNKIVGMSTSVFGITDSVNSAWSSLLPPLFYLGETMPLSLHIFIVSDAITVPCFG